MRKITGTLTTELEKKLGNQQVAKAKALSVSSFRELMNLVSQLSYLNKDYLLFYPGQSSDFLNKNGSSTLYPSIYRGDRLSQDELRLRFRLLTSASRRLCQTLQEENIQGWQDVKRRKYIQWSILQHYEVCQTPLLDLTHSLRVACSFALLTAEKADPCVYVFGLPYITNRISINSEHDIVNVRLLSICPPDALRPYYQEGYLAGTDEITLDYESKDELDFNNRLIAKFCISQNKSFWGKGFDLVPESVLFPKNDRFKDICSAIRVEVETDGTEPVNIGKFLQEWIDLENIIMSAARKYQERVFSFREATLVLHRKELLSQELQKQLDELRNLRNSAVHEPNRLETRDLTDAYQQLIKIKDEIRALKI
jgi:uncharacterized protein YutE (UPF0331/DUF86 family)